MQRQRERRRREKMKEMRSKEEEEESGTRECGETGRLLLHDVEGMKNMSLQDTI
jgi:hypothetical protein